MAKNEETTNTYYGILMNRKLVDKGIYLFRPEYLIEGTVDECNGEIYFTDQMGNEFNEYDEMVVRRLVTQIKVITEEKIIITFCGTLDIEQTL